MNDDELITRIKHELDESVQQLDGATRSKLTQARHRALAARHRKVWIWPALGGAALASVVAVMVWTGRMPEKTPALSPNDFEMLTSGDSMELYQELEFLEWLEAKEGNGVV